MRRLLLHIIYLSLLLPCVCFMACSGVSSTSPQAEAEQCLDSAVYFIDRTDYTRAMLQLKRAENLLPQLSDDKQKYQICQYIGWINEHSGAFSLALDYQEKALRYAEKTNRPELVVDVLINQANTLYNMQLNDSAWRVNLRAAAHYADADDSQRSCIMKNIAYYEFLNDSLPEAERHAYRAALLAQDPSAMGNALSLLGMVYIRQGHDEKAELLMTTIPEDGGATLQRNRFLLKSEYLERKGDYKGALDAYKRWKTIDDSIAVSQQNVEMVALQNRYDRELLAAEKERQRLWFVVALVALLALVLLITWWFDRRQRTLTRRFHDSLHEVRSLLGQKEQTISQLKQTIDSRVDELQHMQHQLSQFASSAQRREVERLFTSIADTKAGVDVLHALVSGQNISQYGKREETALMQVLPAINPDLAEELAKANAPLTPKETFYCVMEHYGIDDTRKALAFCCSNQALRSTKSRLNKKF